MTELFAGQKVAVIGTGEMGESLIRGLVEQAVLEPSQVVGTNPLIARNEEMVSKYKIEVSADNAEAVRGADLVILAVKPQVAPYIFAELRGLVKPSALVLSIAAGISIAQLQDGFGHSAVARSMPNTPAQIGMGITVWTVTESVTERQKEQAKVIFGALGEEVFMEDEAYLDMATALSGSGPAYVFLLMEAMIDAGVHMGFSRRIARELVFKTIAGSVEYAERSGKHAAELRNEVTSPGGTTAEALYHMEKRSFRTVISRGIWAAYQRSISLGKGLKTRGPDDL